jgi:hypothetical protein
VPLLVLGDQRSCRAGALGARQAGPSKGFLKNCARGSVTLGKGVLGRPHKAWRTWHSYREGSALSPTGTIAKLRAPTAVPCIQR